MPLTGAAARHLRSLAHELKPVVLVGKEGVSKELLAAVDAALLDHELIKVRLSADDGPVERKISAAKIASNTSSEVAQVIGRIVILYRPHPKKPKIKPPRGYTPPKPAARAQDEDEEE
jgi:RNA-binding protein